MKKVSIIIPTYKRPLKLKRALQSAVNQSHKEVEVLVIDDGFSEKDKSAFDVVKWFNDQRISYYPNLRKKGADGARNTGILKSNGDYLSFLDDDDEYMPDKIEMSLKALEKTKADCAVSRFYYEHDSMWYESKFTTDKIRLKNYLLGKIEVGSGSNAVMKRGLFSQVGMWNEDLHRHQDVELLIRILDKHFIIQIDKPLFKVYGHTKQDADNMLEIKNEFFSIISPYIKKLSFQDQKMFYAVQYREVALLYGLENNTAKMRNFLFKSMRHKMLLPHKYMRFILLTIDHRFNTQLDTLWMKSKLFIENK